ncbi:TIGR03943 family putative permease subunit [Gracilibacillus xinjiangensis]|uniref:TIGR03943 family putative permease subunit n=1 Tax=Gracilibacillus xinjiangensis TaxID=1193282 RepID=A0ABV8WRS5_9BACI
MSINWQQFFRAVILFFFFLFILRLHQSGELLKLINPKYETLSKIGGAFLFLLLFVAQLSRIFSTPMKTKCHHTTHHHDHGDQPMNWKKGINYLILIGPLITGFVFPLVSLNASIAQNKGVTMILTNQEGNSSPLQGEVKQSQQELPVEEYEIDPNVYKNTISKPDYDELKVTLVNQSHIDMKDPLFATIYQEITENPESFQGKEISLTGFVFRESSFHPNQLVLGRFLITHCVADASLIGFLTEFDEGLIVKDDTWMRITGKIKITNYQGFQIPLIEVSQKEIVEAPIQQYVYPLTVEILGPSGE